MHQHFADRIVLAEIGEGGAAGAKTGVGAAIAQQSGQRKEAIVASVVGDTPDQDLAVVLQGHRIGGVAAPANIEAQQAVAQPIRPPKAGVQIAIGQIAGHRDFIESDRRVEATAHNNELVLAGRGPRLQHHRLGPRVIQAREGGGEGAMAAKAGVEGAIGQVGRHGLKRRGRERGLGLAHQKNPAIRPHTHGPGHVAARDGGDDPSEGHGRQRAACEGAIGVMAANSSTQASWRGRQTVWRS